MSGYSSTLPLCLSFSVALGCVISYVVCFYKRSSEFDSWKKALQNHGGSLSLFSLISPSLWAQCSPTPGVILLDPPMACSSQENSPRRQLNPLAPQECLTTCTHTHTHAIQAIQAIHSTTVQSRTEHFILKMAVLESVATSRPPLFTLAVLLSFYVDSG